MAEHSRRLFLVAAGTTTMAVGAGVATSLPAAAGSAAPAVTEVDRPDAGDGVVVYVRDAASGEMTVMCGDRESVVRDRRLAAVLAGLAR